MLQVLMIFEAFEELYTVRPLLGRSEGDDCGRLFASARHPQFDETPRSHVKKKHRIFNFGQTCREKPWREIPQTLIFKDSTWTGRFSFGTVGVDRKVCIKFATSSGIDTVV